MVPSYIKKIKKGYCHPLYASKLENLNEMEKFLKNFGKSEQSYIKKVNLFLKNTLPKLHGFACKFYQTFQGKIALKFLQKHGNKREDAFYEVSRIQNLLSIIDISVENILERLTACPFNVILELLNTPTQGIYS